MAYVAQDPNEQEQQNSTNVLGNSSSGTPAPTSQGTAPTGQQSSYVSNGNPYGQYGASPQGSQPAPSATQSLRKSNTGASSGQQTNVQTYIEKNQKGSEALGGAASNQLQTTGDIAKKNLEGVQNKFQQGMEAGTLENRQGAVQEATGAFQQAATATGPEREWKDNTAKLFAPEKDATTGAYSAEDQALVDSNKARVTYGDGSTKDFATQADASDDIDAYNKANPGYFTYAPEDELGVSEDRLSKILNAQYEGPNQLNEIAGYGDAYNKFQDASQLQDQVLKGGNNSQLLDRTFATPQNEYNYGNKLLDNLLLGQGSANEQLKSTAQGLGASASGKLSDDFKAGTKEASTMAAARSQELTGIKDQARASLMETADTRSKEVNDRINEVVENWEKYPQHFRDTFQKELDSFGVKVNLSKEFNDLDAKYARAAVNNSFFSGSDKNITALTGEDNVKRQLTEIESYKDVLDFDLNNYNQLMYSLAPFINAQKPINSSSNESKKILDSMTPDQRYQLGVYNDETEKYNKLLSISGKEVSETYDNGRFFRSGSEVINDKNRIIQETIQNEKNRYKDLNNAKERFEYIGTQGVGRGFDQNAMTANLSQLEAEALGVKGGEGLYNLLKDPNIGVNGLIKTAKSDRNQLVSTDEQSQLARLESIAKLAKDYGVKGSGVNLVNQYGDRDAAGQQNATSALDMDNFTKMMQGAERGFRTDAEASNIGGYGTGYAKEKGLFGSSNATASRSLSQNFGDLVKQGGGYRNMYDDTGVNKDLLKKASDMSKGFQTGEMGYTDPGLFGGIGNLGGDIADKTNFGTGDTVVDTLGIGSNNDIGKLIGGVTDFYTGNWGNLYGNLASNVGNIFGGNQAKAQGRADQYALDAAIANLRSNIDTKINTTGIKNQLGVKQNDERDAELFKLLGMMDTTNL